MNEQTPDATPSSASLPRPPRRRRWLTLVLAGVVFVSGLAVGSGLTFLYVDYRRAQYLAHPEEAGKRFTARLKRDLHLTDAQARQVQVILDDLWPKFQETRRQMYPAFKAHLDTLQVKVAAVLREDQRGKWEEYVETIRRLWNPPPPTSAPAAAASNEATSAPSAGP